MSIKSQLDRIEAKAKKRLEKVRDKLAEGIKKDLREMLESRIPIDTKTLQEEGLTIESMKTADGITVDVFVNGISLDYPGKRESIRADVLGLILDIGVRGGRQLKRTQSQPKNPAKTPTAGWFTQDFKADVLQYIEQKRYVKWLTSFA